MKAFVIALVVLTLLPVVSQPAEDKPVFLYSRYFNAEGETRYLPDGTFKDVLGRLKEGFDVRVHSGALSADILKGVHVVLIANPSDRAVGNHPPPPHVTERDISTLTHYLEQGGGLIVMGNQEDHNLEIKDMNKLLGRFGIQFTNVYTDAKKLALPKDAPLIGGKSWAYYTGNQLLLDPANKARPKAVVMNDLTQKPAKGERDAPGVLMASATPGQGKLVVVTDSGWITDAALSGEGIGGVSIKEQDNWEILQRIALWAASEKRVQ